MIHYSLVCAEAHEFDGWFRDSATFDAQAAGGHVSCPFCQSSQITRAPMAPHVARGGKRSQRKSEGAEGETRDVALLDERHEQLRGMIRELRQSVIAATEDVGERFPTEARKIQDGDAPDRPIRGRATFAEAKALLDEGIEILALPGSLTGEGS